MPSLNTGNAILSNPIKVDSSYNVGIGGAASGSFKLQVTGTTNLTGALTGTSATFSGAVEGTIFNSTSNAFRFSGSNALSLVTLAGQNVVKINAAGYWGVQLVGANDQGLLINNTGNVGIGTSSPQLKLDIQTGSLGAYHNTASSGGAQIYLGDMNFAGGAYATSAPGIGAAYNSSQAVAGDLAFYIYASTASSRNEAMRIKGGTGNVGIGTTNATSKLTVSGDATINAGTIAAFSFGVTSNSTFAFGSTNGRRSAIIAHESIGDSGLQFGWDTVDKTGIIAGSANVTGAGIDFYTFNGSSWGNRMRITSGGNVGIATVGFSDTRLAVYGQNTTSSNYCIVGKDSAGTDLIVVRNDGLIFAPPTFGFTTGSAANLVIFSDGSIARSTSSLKYKNNVENYTKGLTEVMQMRPVTYNSINEREDGILYAGLIAEEVHDLGLTEFVQYAEDGSPDALSYGNMVSLLVKAIQELNQTVQNQQQQINSLINR